MPFELGIDFGCKRFGGDHLSEKTILILERTKYDYQKSLSDISGWDIHVHDESFEEAIRRVRDWLIDKAGAERMGAARIQGKYATFQEWYWKRERAAGASEEDIKKYPTNLFVKAMHEWVEAGEPA